MLDRDGDGFGDQNVSAPVEAGTDCDDANFQLNPFDFDGDGYSPCTGDCDEYDSTLNGYDGDGDGFSNCMGDCDDTDSNLESADLDGDGFSTCDGDCDDSDPFAYPGAAELSSAVLCMRDADEDGHGTAVVSGLDAYSIPALLDRLSYAEPGSEPKSIL